MLSYFEFACLILRQGFSIKDYSTDRLVRFEIKSPGFKGMKDDKVCHEVYLM